MEAFILDGTSLPVPFPYIDTTDGLNFPPKKQNESMLNRKTKQCTLIEATDWSSAR
jgi:hypothetical protein